MVRVRQKRKENEPTYPTGTGDGTRYSGIRKTKKGVFLDE
jgi:hypothetical protein